LERDRLFSGESGRTTAHLTEVLDSRYHGLISDFGVGGARLVARSSREAIEKIASRVMELDIDCGFERLPGYLYAEDRAKRVDIEREFEACRKVGLDCSLTSQIPLPFAVTRALRVENQAQFHPGLYLAALAHRLVELGGRIFEGSPVIEIHDGKDGEPCLVRTLDGEVLAKDVVIATDSPMSNRLLLLTKVAAYRTYALAVQLASGTVPYGLFWDTEEPYHYTRAYSRDGEDWLIVGGEDHKVGIGDPASSFERIEAYCRSRYDVGSVSHRWSGEVLEAVDGLPYIGKNPASAHQYVATGFSGNGMTFGTIASSVLSDLILGRENAYAELYSARRLKPLASAATFVSENKDFPACLIGDRMPGKKEVSISELTPGEGAIMSIRGRKAAVYLEENGSVQAVSAVCPHLGCLVRFNSVERSWDCPCHGSRFATSGEVLHGPARSALEPIALEELGNTGLADPAA
jgi:glycine/D-amino acid oxidase-like deaminating enzyme/nitrite reductase/ring-hydroxylating ferredoxin subunit